MMVGDDVIHEAWVLMVTCLRYIYIQLILQSACLCFVGSLKRDLGLGSQMIASAAVILLPHVASHD